MFANSKRSLIRSAVLVAAAIVAQSAVAADPTIMWRSSSTGVITSAAAPSNPSAPPVTPPVTPPPSASAVFKSVGYTGQGAEDWTLDAGREFEFSVPYGSEICDVIDSSPAKKNSYMQTGYFKGQPSGNTPTVSFTPLRTGVFEIVIGCGPDDSSLTPVRQYRVDVK
jgi:hypothetical protein